MVMNLAYVSRTYPGPRLGMNTLAIVEDSPLLQAVKPHGGISLPLRELLLSETPTRRWLGRPLPYLLPIAI